MTRPPIRGRVARGGHAIAECDTCGWQSQDTSKKVLPKARAHAKKHRHNVAVTVESAFRYDCTRD